MENASRDPTVGDVVYHFGEGPFVVHEIGGGGKCNLVRPGADRPLILARLSEISFVVPVEAELSGPARAAATEEGWPSSWPLDDLPLWRESGWLNVAQAWANAGWRPTGEDLQRLRLIAARTGKRVLRPPRGRASSWAPASPALARALSSCGITIRVLDSIAADADGVLSGYEAWVNDGKEVQAAAWVAKGVPAGLASAASDVGIDVHEVSTAGELRARLAPRGGRTIQTTALPSGSSPEMVRSKEALVGAGTGLLLRTRCRDDRLATLRRTPASWIVTDCDGTEHHLDIDDWWQAIDCMLAEQSPATIEPVELDRGRFLLVVAPLAAALGEQIAVDGEDWWTVDGWPATESGAGEWAELDRMIWERPEHLDETPMNSADYLEFVLRRLGDHFLAYEYYDDDVSVDPLAVTSQEEALRAFEARAADPWETERANEEIELAEPLVVRSWRAESGMMGGSAVDELVETATGRLVHRGLGDSPAALYGPEDLGSATDEDGRAEIIASWIAGIGAVRAAALELEPLDPDHHLSDTQRSEWERTIAHHFDTIDFHLDSETLQEVRKRLRGLPEYTPVAAGLRKPQTRDGVLLLEALRERR